MIARSPCYKCENRHTLCHSHCELYLEFRKKRDEINQKKFEEGAFNDDMYTLTRHSIQRMKTRKRGGKHK